MMSRMVKMIVMIRGIATTTVMLSLMMNVTIMMAGMATTMMMVIMAIATTMVAVCASDDRVVAGGPWWRLGWQSRSFIMSCLMLWNTYCSLFGEAFMHSIAI